MHKQKVLFFILLCCAGLRSFSQISANFTIGCTPLNVHFTGAPGADPNTVLWNFGTGGSTSTLADPDNIFNVAGVYNVSYSAMVGGSPYTAVITVTALPKPVGSYNANIPASHCSGMIVYFTGTGGPPGSTFGWGFGSTPASGPSVSHVFAAAGVYTPTMTITDPNGCVGEAVINSTIFVSAPPNISIVPNPGLTSCDAPFNISFSNNSTTGSPLGGALTFNWNFGNGSPPFTGVTPTVVTYGAGNFVLSVTATDNNQCSKTYTAPVTVTQPSLAVTVPGTVCINSAFIVTAQSSQANMSWAMGDGSLEALSLSAVGVPESHTVHIYHTPGMKSVTISVASGTCVTSVVKNIFVERVVASFSATPPGVTCSATMNAQYINQSTVNSSASLNYTWSANWNPAAYNHATFSVTNVLNPLFIFYQNSLNPYTIYNTMAPTITLHVESTSMAHCSADSIASLDSIMRPIAWFNKNKREGCAPLEVTFRDTSFHLALFPVTSYTWNNGASPPFTFSGVLTPPNPIPPHTFTYSTPGTYMPFLTIQTASNCPDVSFVDTVIVADHPTVDLLPLTSTSVCAGQPFQLGMTASTQTTTQHWHVETDNGFFSGCVTNQYPTFYFTHTGTHGFTVSATQNGCQTTSVSTQTIAVKGPFGKARYFTNCTNRKSVDFTTYLQEVQTATLSFGDNSSYVITGNATGAASNFTTHVYATTGNYVATLKSVNALSGCGPHTFTMLVTVRDIKANITITPALPASTLTAIRCARVDSVIFNGSPSIDEHVGCQRGYIWSFRTPANTPTIPTLDQEQPILNRSLPVAGVYTVTLLVKDDNGCVDTDSKEFRISDSKPTFTFNSNPICFSDNPASLINITSGADNIDPINQYKWYFDYFGNPTLTQTVSSTGTTTYNFAATPPLHTYSVVLSATNSIGCQSSIGHVLVVRNPSAAFTSTNTKICIPASVTFTCPPPIYATYTISYSDSVSTLTTTAVNVFKHPVTTSGNHTVTLIVRDSAGCVNSDKNYIQARTTPVASFTTDSYGHFCHPATISFTSTSTTSDNSPIGSTYWDLGQGIDPTSTLVATGIFTTGVTNINLYVFAEGNFCHAQATRTVYVYDTRATLHLNKTKFCLGETITANLTDTHDALTWECNVGFGVQPSPFPVSPVQELSYTYTNSAQTGTTQIIVKVNSPGNACVFTPTPVPVVEIIKLDPGFNRNLELSVADSAHCIKIPDKFTPAVNTTTTPLLYSWDFGNGESTTAHEPNYTFPQAGIWPVHLIMKAEGVGCDVSATKNMTINALPTVTLVAADNCPDRPFIVTGNSSGAISGTWSPVQNIVSPPTFTSAALLNTFTASALAQASTGFSLTVTDNVGCVSEEAVKTVFIQQPANISNKDTTIVIGQPVPISLDAGSGFTYTWTPVTIGLNCTDCYNPIANSTVNITYTVIIADKVGCGAIEKTYRINILDKASVDVPSAFTPNGDGVNDIIYVDGWGIKKLNYFRIYNRWGQLIFESNDVKIGWDGYFNSIPQNMETYVYQVSVNSFLDEKTTLKTGTIKLIR